MLAGNRELFDGLWISQSDYSWQKKAVIVLDFSKLLIDNKEMLRNRLQRQLLRIAKNFQIVIEAPANSPDIVLEELVHELYERYGHVAILVDEYDSPIVRALHDENLSKEISDEIQQFFTLIKGLDEQVEFLFITGVNSFAKAGLFSGINNLQTITLNHEMATICGYTDLEVNRYFFEYMQAWAKQKQMSYEELRTEIKKWYNGYCFAPDAISVYNPFSLMKALKERNFKNFWFESGTPTFLIDQFKKESRQIEYQMLTLEDISISEGTLGIFDVGKTPLTTLMFHTGYLTITGYNDIHRWYTLGYPNQEVKKALEVYFLEVFTHLEHQITEKIIHTLYKSLEDHQIENFVKTLKQLFAEVPYQLHMKEEKFYHALLQMACSTAGLKAQSEYSTSHGRIDLVIEMTNRIYVIEVKFNQAATVAISQIEERQYCNRFLSQPKPLTLLGLSFHREPQFFDITYALDEIPL